MFHTQDRQGAKGTIQKMCSNMCKKIGIMQASYKFSEKTGVWNSIEVNIKFEFVREKIRKDTSQALRLTTTIQEFIK